MRYLRTNSKDKGSQDHFIEVCGTCPDQISQICIRKHVVVDTKKLYEKCPLPVV
jgi:hypothetical protein